jgi:hypothetical protein
LIGQINSLDLTKTITNDDKYAIFDLAHVMKDIPDQMNDDIIDKVAEISSNYNIYILDSEISKTLNGSKDLELNDFILANTAIGLKIDE